LSVRLPAVAGAFYDARPGPLERDVRRCLPGGVPAAPAFGIVAPHAGYVYSGEVAGAAYARTAIPEACVLLCPNHTGRGAAAALDPSEAWRTPLGDVPLDRELARRLLALAPSLEEDPLAHRGEHSLEVQLPFLQVLRPGVRIVPICLGEPSLALCREVGDACARLAAESPAPVLLIASSDMNHFEPRDEGRRKDDLALARVAELDPEGLFRTVREQSISMCGFLPVTALLFAARAAGASRATIVARADSGDRTGDVSSVVGYASVTVSRHEP
jgi:MEMO1 family protein